MEYLSLLQKYNLVAVPFENLTLHYSPHRAVVIHPEALFQKIVGDNNGRGGYCMENNYLYVVWTHTTHGTLSDKVQVQYRPPNLGIQSVLRGSQGV